MLSSLRGSNCSKEFKEFVVSSEFNFLPSSTRNVIPTIMIALKDGCPDKGLDTYVSQAAFLSLVINSAAELRVELQAECLDSNSACKDYVLKAIGIHNPFRAVATYGWLGMTGGIYFCGVIPVIVYCFDNGGDNKAPYPLLEVDVGDRAWNGADSDNLRNAEFKTTNLRKGQMTPIKTIVIECPTDWTLLQVKRRIQDCAGMEHVAIGFQDFNRNHGKTVVNYDWHADTERISSCVDEGTLPKHSAIDLPYFFAVSIEKHLAYDDMSPDIDEARRPADIWTVKRGIADDRKKDVQRVLYRAKYGPEIDRCAPSTAIPTDSSVVVSGVGGGCSPTPDDDSRREFEIHSITNHRYERIDYSHPTFDPFNLRNLQFLVKWTGYDSTFDSWEPYSSLEYCKALDVYAREPEHQDLIPTKSSKKQRR